MATISFSSGELAGRVVEIPEGGLTLGRGHDAGVTLNDSRVSREHALIRQDGGSWWIHDLKSSNGITVNDAAVEAVVLGDGDRVRLGESIFTFQANGTGGSSTAVPATPEPAESAPREATVHAPPTAKGKTTPPEAGMDEDDMRTIADLHKAYEGMKTQLSKVIVGQQHVIEQVLVAIFCRGHALLVGVPGLAKTLLVSTLSHVLDLSFKRIQFTPDLMPSDITGTDVLEEDQSTGKRSLSFMRGPIFANMVLADEINRTPPKTQASLLEAMQEHRVTAGSRTYHLPEPFFVLATQNPIEQEGTYPLPEAQLDRFMFNILVQYPTAEEESDIIRQVTGTYRAELDVALTGEDVLRLQQVVRRVPVADHVIDYARDLARATRPKESSSPDFVKEMVAWGAGPRAGIYLVTAAKAHAILQGRYHATTADVTTAAMPVLRHRVITTFNAEAAGVGSDEIVRMLIDKLRPSEQIDI